MNQEKIGKFIKEIRKKENLSQKQFAEKYGVTYQAVSKWETGKNIPDITILKMMCEEYNMNLDELLNAKKDTSKFSKDKKLITILVIVVLVISLFVLMIVNKKDNDFELKTLAPVCDNFKLYGTIAYNDNKTSIHISNISYCGKEDLTKYKKIECTLYETSGKTKKEISKYNYEEKKRLTLDEFLNKVHFNVSNYAKTCKVYKENSLHLEIDLTSENDDITSYKIPLSLEDNCDK